MKPTPDAAEIVTQLRCASRVRDENYIPLHLSPADCKLAADEIERLRAALEPFAEVARWAERNGHDLMNGWDMLIRGAEATCHLGVQSPEFIDALRALNGQPLGAREQHGRDAEKSARDDG